MATPTRTTKEIVLVGREGDRKNVFNSEGMQKLIDSCDAQKDLYTVVSVIGPQSGGKSTLMNGIFNTDFAVMDESKHRGRTTKGIWASICIDARAIVLDVEGTDSVDNQNDLGFEMRSALFSLVTSNVIFVNIWLTDVNRAHGNPLLKKIFEEIQKQAGPEGLPGQYKKRIVFAVRNYDGRTPEEKLKETIISNVKEIWRTIPQKENSKLENYFKLHVELLPNLYYEEDKFYNKCKQLRECIAHGDWVDRNATRLPVSQFSSLAKEFWDKILENKALDIPSQMEMMARTTIDSIFHDKFHLFCSKKYLELAIHQYDDPKQFDDKLRQILHQTIHEYNNETQLYGKYANEKKIDLETKILHHAEKEFLSVTKSFERRIIEKFKLEINGACGKQISGLKEHIKSVVDKYNDEYFSKTKGLVYYNKLVDKEKFKEVLQLLGKNMAHKIKKKNVEQLILKVAAGVLTGVAAAAAALTAASPSLGPLCVIVAPIYAAVGSISAVGATACVGALEKSEEARRRAAEEALNDFMGKEYISKIKETASNIAEVAQFKMDPNGNAVKAGHELGRKILDNILETQATEETRDKLRERILPIITGLEASGIEFGTKEDNEHYAHLIAKGLSEHPSDKAR